MNKVRYFHGAIDTYHAAIGRWKVTKREVKQAHIVESARHILYRFSGHTHPYVQQLVQELVVKDIAGLQRLDTDVDLRRTYFATEYAPTKIVDEIDPAQTNSSAVAVAAIKRTGSTLPEDGLPVDDLDFDYQAGAYAVYNWEIFYHAPYLIALHLSKNGRFAEAQRWFHYIFDPTDNSDPALGPMRFWKVKPFRIDEVEHIEQVLFNLAIGDDPVARDSTVRAIGAWRDNPFRPHLVARTRPTAYMYATAMAYLDNLIAWGDALFQQDTRESINEAMQFYVLAANILGPRPQAIPPRGSIKKQTYASLKNNLDEFGNAATKLEPEIGFDLFPPPQVEVVKPEHAVIESVGRSLYFCAPRNEKLLGYWDTIGDRLYKIRNSLNLQGAFRQLPLFPPPIDPAMFARAVAAGVDIGAIIDGTAGALAPVRFQVLLQKALEMAQEVKSLGGQILAATEKKDGEALSVLRSRHEVAMMELADHIKYAQWRESVKNKEGVMANLENAFQRFRHYDRLLGTDEARIERPEYSDFDRAQFETRFIAAGEPSVEAADPVVQIGSSFRDGGHKISDEEATEIDLLEASQILQDVATVIESIGAIMAAIPEVEAAAKPLGVGVGVNYGGSHLAAVFRALTQVSRGVASRIGHEAGLASKMAGFARREQDWTFQRKLAAGEMTQLYKQLRGAEIREYIAKREHEHHATQMQQSRDVLEFLTNEANARKGDQRKVTTEDFYLWMRREAQALHSKCFQFAYDIAKKAETALRFELADSAKTFIRPGYLAGKEGLFAGEKLYFDLKRMDFAYTEQNQRELEITRHISLREWFPLALIGLRKDGTCSFELPEQLFDLDCPGHSYRRIKSVALTLPSVTGPFVSANCSVTLGDSHVRTGGGGYPAKPDADTTNFTIYNAAVRSIVTSSAQSDSGLFEANLRDERYLPFEGSGVIGKWTLQLLGDPPAFDYDTIADAILTIRYTAKAGGGNVAQATAEAKTWLKENSARVFSMRHEFASGWAKFKRPPEAEGDLSVLPFTLAEDHFSYRMKLINDEPKRLHLFVSGEGDGDVELFRDSTLLGSSQLSDGGAVIDLRNLRSATGDFELRFSSNTLDGLLVVFDWSVDAA